MSESRKPTGEQILVVDDDTRLRDLLKQFLQTEGYAVSTAQDTKEARDQLYSETFDSRAKAYLKELRSQAMIEYKQ